MSIYTIYVNIYDICQYTTCPLLPNGHRRGGMVPRRRPTRGRLICYYLGVKRGGGSTFHPRKSRQLPGLNVNRRIGFENNWTLRNNNLNM